MAKNDLYPNPREDSGRRARPLPVARILMAVCPTCHSIVQAFLAPGQSTSVLCMTCHLNGIPTYVHIQA